MKDLSLPTSLTQSLVEGRPDETTMAKGLANNHKLVDEELRVVVEGALRHGGAAASNLVVVDDLAAAVRKRIQRGHVVVRHARPTVEDKKRKVALLVVPHYAVVGLVALKRNVAFANLTHIEAPSCWHQTAIGKV